MGTPPRTSSRWCPWESPCCPFAARSASCTNELTAGATTVAISHRFATVRKAERVVVLDHGRIVEDGTHEDLIGADGRYAELLRPQAQRFQEPAS